MNNLITKILKGALYLASWIVAAAAFLFSLLLTSSVIELHFSQNENFTNENFINQIALFYGFFPATLALFLSLYSMGVLINRARHKRQKQKKLWFAFGTLLVMLNLYHLYASGFFYAGMKSDIESTSSVAFASVDEHPTSLYPTAKSYVNQLITDCKQAGGVVTDTNIATTIDINEDGFLDHVIDESKSWCEGGGLYGNGGYPVNVYIVTKKGSQKRAFSAYAFDTRMKDSGGRITLQLLVEGSLCGQSTRKIAHTQFIACWRSVRWDSAKAALDFSPLSEIEIVD